MRQTKRPDSMHAARRPSGAWLAALVASCAAVCGLASISFGDSLLAHASKILDGKATAHLHLVRPEGSQLIEEGPVTGALSGSARADFHTGSEFTGTVTILTHAGGITGRGRAAPHGEGRYQSFSGSFTVTSGTGRYIHIHGRAGLYGVFDRRKESVEIQTTGTFTY